MHDSVEQNGSPTVKIMAFNMVCCSFSLLLAVCRFEHGALCWMFLFDLTGSVNTHFWTLLESIIVHTTEVMHNICRNENDIYEAHKYH